MTEIVKYPPDTILDGSYDPYDPNLMLWKTDEEGWHYKAPATDAEKAAIIAGVEYFNTPEYAAEQLQLVRGRRNQKLNESDYIVTRSQEAGVPVPAEWVAYRQALRDITNNVYWKHAFEVVWPEKPVG